MFLAEPVMRDIWSGTQADKALRDIDLADSRINGAVLAEVRSRIEPKADRAKLEASSFLIMQLGEAAMRLAISVEREEGNILVEHFKRMVLRDMLEA
jgi:Tetracyclin repressor-like, C-terminal domain